MKLFGFQQLVMNITDQWSYKYNILNTNVFNQTHQVLLNADFCETNITIYLIVLQINCHST